MQDQRSPVDLSHDTSESRHWRLYPYPCPMEQYMNDKEVLLQNPALNLLSRFFASREESLSELKAGEPDDEAIRDYIGNVFGIMGGGSLNPSGWYEYKGGKHPCLEIQDKDFNTVKRLEGMELVNAFRLVFDILKGQQLSLF